MYHVFFFVTLRTFYNNLHINCNGQTSTTGKGEESKPNVLCIYVYVVVLINLSKKPRPTLVNNQI